MKVDLLSGLTSLASSSAVVIDADPNRQAVSTAAVTYIVNEEYLKYLLLLFLLATLITKLSNVNK